MGMQKQEFVQKGAAKVVAGASLREPVAWHDIMEEGPPERASSSGTYREGKEGREEAQGTSPAIHPDPLAECQSIGGEASDDQPR